MNTAFAISWPPLILFLFILNLFFLFCQFFFSHFINMLLTSIHLSIFIYIIVL